MEDISIRQVGVIKLPECDKLIQKCLEGLQDNDPELIEQGEGGSYFIRDQEGEPIAVFKPNDEEPFSENNPKRHATEDSNNAKLKQKGIANGEAMWRELAAYLLDRPSHFSGVPKTCIVELRHPAFTKAKIGSLQEFIQNDGESWDYGSTQFSTEDVHRIGILDVRIFNLDRHGGNILVGVNRDTGKLELLPIDHAFSLPDSMDAQELWFEWHNWKQAKVPFSARSLSFIESLNVPREASLLDRIGIRPECIRTFVLSSLLLKRAAHRTTLYQIAEILKSPSEPLVRLAKLLPVDVDFSQPFNAKTNLYFSIAQSYVEKMIDSILQPKKNTKKWKSTSLNGLPPLPSGPPPSSAVDDEEYLKKEFEKGLMERTLSLKRNSSFDSSSPQEERWNPTLRGRIQNMRRNKSFDMNNAKLALLPLSFHGMENPFPAELGAMNNVPLTMKV